MKKILLLANILLFFAACSNYNAFNRFEMSQERERSEESIQSSRVMDKDEIVGVVTAVYLNTIYPELYNDAEYFYIYLNIESEEQSEFLLNDLPSLFVEELNSTNPYTKLTDFNADYKRYYFVAFKKAGERIELKVRSLNSSTPPISFKKRE